MFTPSLPGRARAALIVVAAYLTLSVIGIVQVLSVRSQFSRSYRSILDVIVMVTVVIMVLFAIAAVLVLRKTNASMLNGISIASLAFTVLNLKNGISISVLITLAMLVALVVLLSSAEVKNYFADRKLARRSPYVPVPSNY